MLRLNDVITSIGTFEAIQGVSLQIAHGEFVTLLGSNGAGKTTLLRTIAGVLRATGGSILFQNKPIHHLAAHQIVRLGLALCPEGRQLFPELSVYKNLMLGAYVRKDDSQGFRQTLEEVYNLFPVLRERSSQMAGTLSGGQQQMLAIGRALMCKPSMLLLDEPSMGLAPMVVRKIMGEILPAIHAKGTTLFLSEQNANMALAISQRAYVLESGKIVLEGASSELVMDEKVKKAYIGA
ncbi:MAG: ABC transporter ATP-binding protein [bacterium]